MLIACKVCEGKGRKRKNKVYMNLLLMKNKSEMAALMEKRNFKRIQTKIDARFFYGNLFYSGTVLNVSENGMFINTKRFLPLDSMFVVIVRSNHNYFKVIAKVKRSQKSNDISNGVGVELLSPSSDYLKFINNLVTACQ
jgi:hypothetical protein